MWFNGKKKNKETGIPEEYCKPQFEKYIAHNFDRLKVDQGGGINSESLRSST